MKMRTLLLIAFLLSLTGCGVAATHCVEDLTYVSGNKLHADYWIYTGHVLADPDITRIKRSVNGAWDIQGFKEKTDNEGLAAFVTGIGDTITKLFVPH